MSGPYFKLKMYPDLKEKFILCCSLRQMGPEHAPCHQTITGQKLKTVHHESWEKGDWGINPVCDVSSKTWYALLVFAVHPQPLGLLWGSWVLFVKQWEFIGEKPWDECDIRFQNQWRQSFINFKFWLSWAGKTGEFSAFNGFRTTQYFSPLSPICAKKGDGAHVGKEEKNLSLFSFFGMVLTQPFSWTYLHSWCSCSSGASLSFRAFILGVHIYPGIMVPHQQ